MRMKYDTATVHYERSSSKMHEGFLSQPSLFLISNGDVVADPQMVATIYEKWEKKGQSVSIDRYLRHKT